MTGKDSHIGGGPVVRIGDVDYVLGYGAGYAVDRMVWKGQIIESEQPVYVWIVMEDPDTTAMPHVTEELDHRLEMREWVASLESAAGWDPNP